MQISFQHVNPQAGHESTLLFVTPDSGPPSTYLIDAGEDVSLGAFLGGDQSLDGVFLTHAHSDHYESLGRVLSTDPDCPVYTSPATAAIFEQVYGQAAQHRDLGGVDRVAGALTPVESWTALSDRVDVCPVPAGHAPGAAGFLFAVDDLRRNDETVTVLATGDFTTHPVAGYPGLCLPDDVHVDVMVANVTTADEFTDQFTAALKTILEHALGGATTLVGADALAGVHTAYALGQLVAELDREVPVRLVGQTAKLYTELGYDVPSVTARPSFTDPSDELSRGTVTVAGPAAPVQGSTERLYDRIAADSSAAFLQLTASENTAVTGKGCTTARHNYSPHPTVDQFERFVDDHLPRHLVFKHTSVEEAKSLGDSFERFFHWANNDTREHLLYDDGTWVAPEWVSDSQADRIRMKTYRASSPRMPLDQSPDERPTVSLTRTAPDLEAEGVAASELVSMFEVTDTQQVAVADGATETATEPAPGAVDVEAVASELTERVRSELAPVADVPDRLDTVESRLDELEREMATEQSVTRRSETVTDRLERVDDRLDALSTQLDHATAPTLPGTVVRNGELVLLQVEADAVAESDLLLEHGQEVEVTVGQSDS